MADVCRRVVHMQATERQEALLQATVQAANSTAVTGHDQLLKPFQSVTEEMQRLAAATAAVVAEVERLSTNHGDAKVGALVAALTSRCSGAPRGAVHVLCMCCEFAGRGVAAGS